MSTIRNNYTHFFYDSNNTLLMSGNDNTGNKPNNPNNPPPDNNAGETIPNLSIDFGWDEELLKQLKEAGLDDKVNSRIASYEKRLNELEQKQKNQEVESQKKELLLELSKITTNPKLLDDLKDASPDEIRGAIKAEKRKPGPPRFGQQSQDDNEETGTPTMIDPVTGKMMDSKGKLYD